MAESIIGGIAVVAFIVFLSASNAIFEMRKLKRERKNRELELIKQQEEWLLIQKGIAEDIERILNEEILCDGQIAFLDVGAEVEAENPCTFPACFRS